MRVGGVLTEDRTEKLMAVTEQSAGEVYEYQKLQLLLCKGRRKSMHPGELAQGQNVWHAGDPRFNPQYA